MNSNPNNNPKKKAIAKNVRLTDLYDALSKMNTEFIDVEIHQFSDKPNKLIVKPVQNTSELPQLPTPSSQDQLEDLPSDPTNQDIDDIKDLLDLL